jgi:hypothetical protein
MQEPRDYRSFSIILPSTLGMLLVALVTHLPSLEIRRFEAQFSRLACTRVRHLADLLNESRLLFVRDETTGDDNDIVDLEQSMSAGFVRPHPLLKFGWHDPNVDYSRAGTARELEERWRVMQDKAQSIQPRLYEARLDRLTAWLSDDILLLKALADFYESRADELRTFGQFRTNLKALEFEQLRRRHGEWHGPYTAALRQPEVARDLETATGKLVEVAGAFRREFRSLEESGDRSSGLMTDGRTPSCGHVRKVSDDPIRMIDTTLDFANRALDLARTCARVPSRLSARKHVQPSAPAEPRTERKGVRSLLVFYDEPWVDFESLTKQMCEAAP